jgi:L-ribulokinase
VALDWWNGNRSVLVDVQLSGLLVGATLGTTAPDIYRALLESTAFGARAIVEAFEDSDVPVRRIVAAGGLPARNQLLMQIYADVLKRDVHILASTQGPAVGAAMHAAVAAGVHADIAEAARHMGGLSDTVYRPDPASAEVYDELYREYQFLHDLFGRSGEDDPGGTMKRLRALRARQHDEEVA